MECSHQRPQGCDGLCDDCIKTLLLGEIPEPIRSPLERFLLHHPPPDSWKLKDDDPKNPLSITKIRYAGLCQLFAAKQILICDRLRRSSGRKHWFLTSCELGTAWLNTVENVIRQVMRGRFKEEGKLNAYLYRIAFCRTVDVMRRRKKTTNGFPFELLPDSRPSRLDETDAWEHERKICWLMWQLEKLTVRQQEVMRLYVEHCRSNSAATFDQAVDAISWKEKGRSASKAELERYRGIYRRAMKTIRAQVRWYEDMIDLIDEDLKRKYRSQADTDLHTDQGNDQDTDREDDHE